jgi:twitching motility protein PilT
MVKGIDMFEKIEHWCDRYNPSDIHLREGRVVAIRIDGDIVLLEEVIEKESLDRFIDEVLSETQKTTLEKYKNLDSSLTYLHRRYRANFFHTSKGRALVLRVIDDTIVPIAQLGLPDIFQTILSHETGLVLITGPTGSGKSTTLASMIDHLNQTKPLHIITIEDPIEFVYEDQKSIIVQREVGKDAYSFNDALRASLREDPDVILIGELRDIETISLALSAAETGHLVFATLHTSGAANTINRIIDAFPAEQQKQIQIQLAQSLRFVATQKLLKQKDGGRCVAVEVMVCNTSIQNLIRENKVHQIANTLQTSKKEGMITMDKSIEHLQSQGKI